MSWLVRLLSLRFSYMSQLFFVIHSKKDFYLSDGL